jgi:hypothetical protein
MGNILRNIQKNICAYCGAKDNLTKDHVPPKNLFPKPRPNDLVTVKACKSCHSTTSKDDEYFRLKISMREDIASHPAASDIWSTVFRSLSRSQSTGLKKQVFLDLRYVNLKTSSGLYLGKSIGYVVDMKRIRRVVEHTIRGLYFIESGNPLGIENEVKVYNDEDLNLQSQDTLKQLVNNILIPLSTLTPRVIGDGIFLYRYQIIKENPIYSVWALSYYRKITFFAITGSKNLLKIP